MPPTRSANSRHGSRQPLQPQPTPPNGNVTHEVIVLSSDDDEPAPRKPVLRRSARPRARPKLRPAPAPPVPHVHDVVEIISDEDPSPKRTIEELREQLAKAKREIAALKKANTVSERHNGDKALNAQMHRLTAEAESSKASKEKLIMALEDQICCEICTMKMWTPYTLGCGHTFCLTCLQDWFSTVLAQHMNTHPGYVPNLPIPQHYRNLLRDPNVPLRDRRAAQRQLRDAYDLKDHPDYTCPSCRVPVRTKPTEAFTVKNVVRAVAESQGDVSPRKPVPGKARRDDPWDGFFPTLLAPI